MKSQEKNPRRYIVAFQECSSGRMVTRAMTSPEIDALQARIGDNFAVIDGTTVKTFDAPLRQLAS